VKTGIFERAYTSLKEYLLLVKRRAGICVDMHGNHTERLV